MYLPVKIGGIMHSRDSKDLKENHNMHTSFPLDPTRNWPIILIFHLLYYAAVLLKFTYYRISRNIGSDFNSAIWRMRQDRQLTYAIIDPFILPAWVSLHTELKFANLKSHQQHFLSKPSNIMFTNISAYTVCLTLCSR